ncbi:zinc metalloprotease [Mesorhizobium sp. CU2]|uniref:zinc metalloprotease n=1 Tax=unclassified Mesorhizobium TaxID=325217 RepID=UPI001128C61D|nr:MULTISPECIES: zinc metalloprotease [unclassified Mesorhizobium]TPN82572.1 zinc metalloprotease [Mesorhizobium sp. CU3]TPO12777.1 zinc metalloprotease [Mesorhizobium sp. CU2]
MNDESPPKRSCGAMIEYHRLLEQDPGYRSRLVEIEQATQRRVARMSVDALRSVTVPVVVHVVYKKAADNISDAQVTSQIDVLNADYSAANTDLPNVPAPWKSLVGNAKIKFKLAKVDPGGAQTSGIVRQKTTVDGFGQDDSVKMTAKGGSDAWDTTRYLNIWVCDLQGGLLGYAQFPGGPPATDGVVIRNTAFGTGGVAAKPFNLGRTTTHEVGHYLNLRHIWGDTEDCSGSDLVADTPRQQLPNYNEPTFPHVSCNNGPNGDMFVNYMDYVDDKAMFMFSAGQVARMRATLAGPRKDLTTGAAQLT